MLDQKPVDYLVESIGKACGQLVKLYQASTGRLILMAGTAYLYRFTPQALSLYTNLFNKRFNQFNLGGVGFCTRFPQSQLELQTNKY